MPDVYPFRALRFVGKDVSSRIAPPYDVLDAAAKARLLERDRLNIVAIDLPHTPPKEVGPAGVYAQAGEVYRRWRRDGTLMLAGSPAIYIYRQRFTHIDGSSQERIGIGCCIDVVPLGRGSEREAGGAVLPHEETFSGPKEDRMALMRATRAQLSPIFALHEDEDRAASAFARRIVESGEAETVATTPDGVHHEVWGVADGLLINEYQRIMAGRDLVIADGHHRYTTQLNYIRELEAEHGTALPREHPARRSMVVLVPMSDPGLVIWPTHRVLGGMDGYSFDRLMEGVRQVLSVRSVNGGARQVEASLHADDAAGPTRFGLYDFAEERGAVAALSPSRPDALGERFAGKPVAWRQLAVAVAQHVIVEDICQGMLNGGRPVRWAFPHTIDEVEAMGSGRAPTPGGSGDGGKPQLAVILRPTPLASVSAICAAGELMPQKSTYFHPKLATGLWINALE